VKSFRERPLAGPYKYVWLDALVLKCRDGGRIANVACLVAVGVKRRRPPRGAGPRGRDRRGWRRLARLPAQPARSWAQGSRARDLRHSPWPQGRHRLGAARSGLAALPNALHPQPAHEGAPRPPTVSSPPSCGPSSPSRTQTRCGPSTARTVEQLAPRFREAPKMLAEVEEILAFTVFPKEH